MTASTDRQENKRLKQHVKAVERLAGSAPGTDELVTLLDEGYLPHYDHAARATVSASLAMSTTRTRKTEAGGSVTVGPLVLRGELSNAFGQETATNVQVSIELERRLVAQSYAELLAAFGPSG